MAKLSFSISPVESFKVSFPELRIKAFEWLLGAFEL